jgi:hypothetical protein
MTMKKYIILILLVLLVGIVFAEDIYDKPNAYWWTGHPSADTAWEWAKNTDGVALGPKGTGKFYYVDSGVANEGDGGSWTDAKNTLEEGINLCTANRGDRIYVAQGHNLQTSAGAVWDADIAGITIIGCGHGSLMPTWEFEYASSTCTIGADNITLVNLRFEPATDTIVLGVEVESGADYARFINCEFGPASVSTQEFGVALQVGTSVGTIIEGCIFDAGAAQASVAIRFEDGEDLVIRNNIIRGDYSSGNIYNYTTLAEDVLIEDNLLWNGVTSGLNTVEVIDVLAGTIGITRRNYAAANLATVNVAFVGDGLFNFGNYYNESAGGAKTALALDMVAGSNTYGTVTPTAGE